MWHYTQHNIQHYEYVLFDYSDCFSVHIAQVKMPHRKFLHVVVVVVVVVEMSIIKVALSHFCCRTTVQSDSVSVARQVTVRRW